MSAKLNAKIPLEGSEFRPTVYEDVMKMRDNYESTLPTGETRSGWVSAKEISSLLSDNLANGIRIYLGRHEDDDEEYPGRLNMILVATVDKVAPDNPKSQNSKDQLNPDAEIGPVGSVSYKGLGDDRVPLCPPNCP